MFTARLNMTTNVMHVWVNATPGSTPPLDSTAVVPEGSTFTAFAFNGISLGGFNNTPIVPRFVDEIRIGKTFGQVAPSSVVTNALANFRSANGLPANGSDDLLMPANDGVTNLQKFAFNMIGNGTGQVANLGIANAVYVNPLNGIAGLPSIAVNSQGRLSLTYVRTTATANSGISSTVEFSNTLVSDWAENMSATEVVSSIGATYERVTVTDSIPASPRRFVRVRVAVVAP